MILFLQSVKARPFKTADGDTVEYFWYKAKDERGVTIEFGSKVGDLALQEEHDLTIEKTERANGKFGYKHVLDF